MQRYFVEEKNNNKFILNKEDSYHITKVMRMNKDEKIEIISSKKTHICKISILEPLVEAEVEEVLEENNELQCAVTLVQSLVKEQKMDYILQKATELGASEIIPLATTRSVVKMDKKETKKIERWQKIVKEASEQSKRNEIPTIRSVMSIKELSGIKGYDVKLLCTVRENTKNIKNLLSNSIEGAKMIVVVGPEGGFTEQEEEQLIKGGFETVSLGSSVLRTETAPLFIMSVVRYIDMR